MVGLVFDDAPLAAIIFGEPAAVIVVPDFPRDLASLNKKLFDEDTGAWLFDEESGAAITAVEEK